MRLVFRRLFIGMLFLLSRKAAENLDAATPIAAKQRTQSLDLRNLRASRNAGRPGCDVTFLLCPEAEIFLTERSLFWLPGSCPQRTEDRARGPRRIRCGPETMQRLRALTLQSRTLWGRLFRPY